MTKRDPHQNLVEGQPGLPKRTVSAGARTPEELEVMFEDALLIGEKEVVAELFDDVAALVIGAELPVRDGEAIARLALTTWQGSHAYLAGPLYVAQVGEIALILAEEGINVARRSREGAWRYVIVLRSVYDSDRRNQ